MRLLVFALFLTFGLNCGALAQGTREVAFSTVIAGQLTAFEQRDLVSAFSYAAPTIQNMFGAPVRFGAMVASGYPMIWNADYSEMLDVIERNGEIWQKVMITAKDAGIHLLAYRMIETDQGWKIAAVQIIKALGIGT